MLTKKLGEKAIFNRLEKYVNSHYNEELEFFGDTENENYYIWNVALNGNKFQISCNKKSGKVTDNRGGI